MMNFRDMSSMHAEQKGTFFFVFLDAAFGTAWRKKYRLITSGGMFLATFRALLKEVCGVHNWLEITSGRSYAQWRALDLYLRIVSAGMKSAKYEAWFLLNSSGPVSERISPSPELWWWYHELRSWGQKPVMSEWFLEVSGVIMHPTAARRIAHVIDHLNPPGMPPLNPAVAGIPQVFRMAMDNVDDVRATASGVARMSISPAVPKSRD